jgi:hypothetical protein
MLQAGFNQALRQIREGPRRGISQIQLILSLSAVCKTRQFGVRVQ